MDTSSTAAVLLLNLPPKALGGIDLLSFTTTPKFQGIKNLPKGFHFVFTASTSSLSVRHGAWIHVQSTGPRHTSNTPPDLFVKKWDASSESLLPETEHAQLLHWRANLGSIWREGLTPYRQSAATSPSTDEFESNDWAQLTSHMTRATLSRILDPNPDHCTLTSASSAKVDVDDIPGLSAAEVRNTQDERELRFLPVDLKQTWREGATGRERTEAAQDRSWYLDDLVSRHCSSSSSPSNAYDEILAELEFTFLMILTLNNYSSLEQYRRLITLVLTCKALITTHPSFYTSFFSLLKLQFQHCDDTESASLLDFSEEDSTFLKPLLSKFKRVLEIDLPSSTPNKQDVMDEFDALTDYLDETHGWSFSSFSLSSSSSHHQHHSHNSTISRNGILTLEDGEEIDLNAPDDHNHAHTGFSSFSSSRKRLSDTNNANANNENEDDDDEEDESGEYAPQIVDLTPEQMRELGFLAGAVGGAAESEAFSPALPLRRGKSLRQTIRDQDAEDEDEEDEDGGVDRGVGSAYGREVQEGSDDEEEQEEMDLEDMDARY
ncbi:hypothetical protein AAFC00_001497 [Neodothiora populina]|uniref:A1 cistron-splicing factor n=1 Tax=Neodothiora populina TaxID=2781224 RepID=A0ABR3PQ68_9PEZI